MTVSSKTLAMLINAGLEGQDLIDVVSSIEEDCRPSAQRSAAAERQRRYRERKASNSCDVTDDVTRYVTDGVTGKSSLDKEKVAPKEINPSKEKTPKGVQKKSPKAILSEILSESAADAVIAHRQKIKKPLSERAAELLAAKFSRVGSIGLTPDQAADVMIERGWQGFELDWLRNCRPPEPQDADPLKAGTLMRQGDKLVPTTETRWRQRVSSWQSGAEWSRIEWGPMPGETGCNVPAHILTAQQEAA